jgi:hypothetical protein
LALIAHIDEIGLIITHVDETGRFTGSFRLRRKSRWPALGPPLPQ